MHDHGHHDHGHRHSHDHAPAPPAPPAAPDHAHDHGHSHSHSHTVAAGGERAFAIGILLNAGFVLVEVTAGFTTGSVALLADASHNLGDVLGLVLAWGATRLASRASSERRTWGMRRATILAALTNALLTVGITGGIAWESVERLFNPSPVPGSTIMVVALVGVLINGVSAMLFAKAAREDLNQRAAYVHLLVDAAASLAVVVCGALVWATGLSLLDPLVGLLLSGFLLWGTWNVLRQSLDLALDAAPANLDVGAVRRWLADVPGVTNVHDLHIWAVSTTDTALVAHLVLAPEARLDLAAVARDLETHFRIGHATLQVEPVACGGCGLRAQAVG